MHTHADATPVEWTSELGRLSLDGELDDALLPAQLCELLTHSHCDDRQHGHTTDATVAEVQPLDYSLRPSMHEHALLAEAEDLFATLDATAFADTVSPTRVDDSSSDKSSWTAASSPVSARERSASSSSSSSTPSSPARSSKRQKRERKSPLSLPTATSTNTVTSPRAASEAMTKRTGSAMSWRDKVREEIVQLRALATKLECQRLDLELQTRSSAALTTTRVQIWQRLAARQLRLRDLAVAENAQLKAMLATMLHAGDSSSGSQQQPFAVLGATRLPNYLVGPPRVRITPPPRDAVMASVFEPLLAGLDRSYAELDAVFTENGMNTTPPSTPSLEPQSYMQRKMRRLGHACRYIELGDTRSLPFDWRLAGLASWQCNRAWHRKDQPYEYPCDGNSDSGNTFAVNYRVTHRAFAPDESVDFKLAVRHYLERDRSVFLYTCQSDGEQALAGVTVRKVGWVVTRAAELGASDAAPVSTVQSCMHVFLDSSADSSVSSDRVNRLVNLMMCAFEEDVVSISQNADNQLLENSRQAQSNARLQAPAEPAFSTPLLQQQLQIEPSMPRVQLEDSIEPVSSD